MSENGHRRKRLAKSDIVVRVISLVIVTIFAVSCLLPFVYVFFVSFMPYSEYIANPLKMIPTHFVLTAYKQMWGYSLVKSGYLVTLFITVVGTLLSIFLLVISAYPLSRTKLKGQKVVMTMIIFTMFFSGGMIPNYLLIKDLHLINSLWAMILPDCFSAFYLILMRSFIKMSVPEELEEAAKIDGANDIRILFSIVIPILKPAIATMVVFCSVGYWNNYFSAMLYEIDRNHWPLSLVLRELLVEDNTSSVSSATQVLNSIARTHPFTLKMAAIVITTLPILIVYPFMQRYFVKGISLGAVKG